MTMLLICLLPLYFARACQLTQNRRIWNSAGQQMSVQPAATQRRK